MAFKTGGMHDNAIKISIIIVDFCIGSSHRIQWKRVWMGGGGGGVWNSLISKNLAHYSLSLKFLLIL